MLILACLLVRSLVRAHRLHHCLPALLCLAIYLAQRYLLSLLTDAVPAESVVFDTLLVRKVKGKVQPPPRLAGGFFSLVFWSVCQVRVFVRM